MDTPYIICRFCLSSSKVWLPIFDGNIPSLVEDLTSLKIFQTDGLPSTSCLSCFNNIVDAHKMKYLILESDHKLKLETNLTTTSKPKIVQNDSIKSQQELSNVSPQVGLDHLIESTKIEGESHIPSVIKIEKIIDDRKTSEILISLQSDEDSNQSCNDSESKNSFDSDSENDKNASFSEALENETKGDHKFIDTDSFFKGISNKSKTRDSENDFVILVEDDEILERIPNSRPTSYFCKFCNKNIGNIKISLHKNKHKKAKCKICGLVTRADNMKKHVFLHRCGPQVCEICGSWHKSMEGLRSHIYNFHKKKDPFKCDECGKEFHLSGKLQLHKRKVHIGHKPHKCDYCEKSFFESNVLKKHINLVHLGLREYLCEYCNRKYSSRYALKTHKRQHTGELPYQCSYCSEGFRQGVSLRTHLKSKHNIIVKANKPGYTDAYLKKVGEKLIRSESSV